MLKQRKKGAPENHTDNFIIYDNDASKREREKETLFCHPELGTRWHTQRNAAGEQQLWAKVGLMENWVRNPEQRWNNFFLPASLCRVSLTNKNCHLKCESFPTWGFVSVYNAHSLSLLLLLHLGEKLAKRKEKIWKKNFFSLCKLSH